jgi:hypothetical protein
VGRRLDPDERRLWNGLAAVRLALQILEARTELSDRQLRLVRTALRAADQAAEAAGELARPTRGAGPRGS